LPTINQLPQQKIQLFQNDDRQRQGG